MMRAKLPPPPIAPRLDLVWQSDPHASSEPPPPSVVPPSYPTQPAQREPAPITYPPTAITLPPAARPAPAPVSTGSRRALFAAAAGVVLGGLIFSVALGASVADASPSTATMNRDPAPVLAAATPEAALRVSEPTREVSRDQSEPESDVVDAESLPLLDLQATKAPRQVRARRAAVAPRSAPRAVTSRGATLNFNSIPVSTVLVDGRPVGTTPLRGVQVAAGTHSVVFANASGRRVASVKTTPGSNKTVVVRFDR